MNNDELAQRVTPEIGEFLLDLTYEIANSAVNPEQITGASSIHIELANKSIEKAAARLTNIPVRIAVLTGIQTRVAELLAECGAIATVEGEST